MEELLHYYRAYDEFKEPQPIAELKEDTIAAVGGILAKTADVVRYGARPAGYDGWIAGQRRHTGAGMVQYALSARDAQGGGTLYFP